MKLRDLYEPTNAKNANSVVLEAYNEALISSKDPRWRVEHAQIIDTQGNLIVFQ